MLLTQGFVGVFFVVDEHIGLDQLDGHVPDLRHRRRNNALLGLAVDGPLDHSGQSTANRQQQRHVIAQMLGQHALQRQQQLNHVLEQRQLFFNRHVFVKSPIKAPYQPTDGGGTGAQFDRVNKCPALRTQVVQQPQPRQQPRERFALIKRPGQPDGGTQVLGLIAQHRLALLMHHVPVDLVVF